MESLERGAPTPAPPHEGEGFQSAPLSPSPLWGGVRGGGRERSEPPKNNKGTVWMVTAQTVQPSADKLSGKFFGGRFAPPPTPNPSPQGGGGHGLQSSPNRAGV
jgi:hypothetical protein